MPKSSIRIRFSIKSPELDAQVLTSIIAVEPTQVHKKGDMHRSGKYAFPNHLWVWETEVIEDDEIFWQDFIDKLQKNKQQLLPLLRSSQETEVNLRINGTLFHDLIDTPERRSNSNLGPTDNSDTLKPELDSALLLLNLPVDLVSLLSEFNAGISIGIDSELSNQTG